jgi:hypothetical protein
MVEKRNPGIIMTNVNTWKERTASGPYHILAASTLAPELLALVTRQGLDRRRPSRSQAPLLTVLPCVE